MKHSIPLLLLALLAPACGLPSVDVVGVFNPPGYTCYRHIAEEPSILRLEFEAFNNESRFEGYIIYYTDNSDGGPQDIRQIWSQRNPTAVTNQFVDPRDTTGFEYIIRDPFLLGNQIDLPSIGRAEIERAYEAYYPDQNVDGNFSNIQRPFRIAVDIQAIPNLGESFDPNDQEQIRIAQQEQVLLERQGTHFFFVTAWSQEENRESALSNEVSVTFENSTAAPNSDLPFSAECQYPLTELPCALWPSSRADQCVE